MRSCQKGDETARALLIERNLRLVVYIARKFENTGINIEDLISIGTIGLIKAVNTFNPEKKRLSSPRMLHAVLKMKFLMHLRRNNKKNRSEVSFDEPLNIDWDGNELLLSDVLGTEDDIITKDLEANVNRHLLLKALHQLNDREKQIMELRFGLDGSEEKNTKGCCRHAWHLTIVYFSLGKSALLNAFARNSIKWSSIACA
ncbi:hypothetical protein GCM10020331_045900 [Ectobacillus funiculus]